MRRKGQEEEEEEEEEEKEKEKSGLEHLFFWNSGYFVLLLSLCVNMGLPQPVIILTIMSVNGLMGTVVMNGMNDNGVLELQHRKHPDIYFCL